ncbi:MAG: malate dehydrogenase [Deltaproteobacteria bacterium RIFCSPHIGHO2_12_FULL_43_9]|nr:MAG: malate dehydrogenase [Deltaproteobacteria bacterium RIFCSPHIGHO2_12_FULL_43_9]
MKRSKITIIGAGHVGATAAHWAMIKNLGDIVLIDIQEGVPQGKGLDLLESSPIAGIDSRITGTNNYAEAKDSDVVIVTAGLPRKPGMSRDDLIAKNTEIVKNVTEQIVKYCPKAFLIIVSNPLDAMVYVVSKVGKFPNNMVVGMAGVLDSARFRTFISEALGVSVEDVSAFVLGGHGDTMVPLPRYCSVGGIPITELLPKEKIEEIVKRTRNGGAEIVNLLKTGSAYYAPSAAAIEMAESYIRDKKRILPCAAYLNGEFGVKGVFVGVLAQIGGNGIEKIIEFPLTDEEKDAFQKSVDHVKELCKVTKV